MAIINLVHGLLFVLEDLIAWKLGATGISFWVVLVIGFLIAFLFWKPLVVIIKKGLSLVGIK